MAWKSPCYCSQTSVVRSGSIHSCPYIIRGLNASCRMDQVGSWCNRPGRNLQHCIYRTDRWNCDKAGGQRHQTANNPPVDWPPSHQARPRKMPADSELGKESHPNCLCSRSLFHCNRGEKSVPEVDVIRYLILSLKTLSREEAAAVANHSIGNATEIAIRQRFVYRHWTSQYVLPHCPGPGQSSYCLFNRLQRYDDDMAS